ncbi:hypothetical protein CLRAG_02330 [Clostridium ragsdalei P11]|uniref:N-acetyltransferase domain-containing protein n=1 Tax=Clostridium ragsdalei P11 TaxID=1353534 RepID=A0A1A6B368_9CLOT|nr:acetyltransferase [Clostridium ragsdalei]OBR96725.1 hypothetical protein CLRAG_02330 [Clostridium ragsdalei P11]
MSESFSYEYFASINLNDPFFDSLKNDYKEFIDWFHRKTLQNQKAYIQKINNKIEGFLYLKIEKGPIKDVDPILNVQSAIKIGTLKINPHGTRLGERFIKKSIDYAIDVKANTIYVTVFESHPELIKLLEKYGFYKYGKKTTSNGIEFVLVKDLESINNDTLLDYPRINPNTNNIYLLGIYPKYHTNLFPDSKLNNEPFDIVKDVSHTNSIEKIYICKMRQVASLRKNDLLLIYRTSDKPGLAKFRSVATSICTVEDVKSTKTFNNFMDFKKYCKNYSVFPDDRLEKIFYSKHGYYIIKMTYNVALKKRIINKDLIENVGLDSSSYWGFFKLNSNQLKKIIEIGEVNEGYIIH